MGFGVARDKLASMTRCAQTTVGLVLTVVVVAAGTASAVPRKAFTFTDPRISESSGLAMSSVEPQRVLTHNDSGGRAEYFVIDAATGGTVRRVAVPGATNVDWEDMAVADGTVYLADIGDNRAQREFVTIYRMRERDGSALPPLTLTYDDGAHDAEALLVSPDGESLSVVTKDLLGSRVYERAGKSLVHKGKLATRFVTGGAQSPDGSRIALLTYNAIAVYDTATWPQGKPVELALPALEQAEAVTWADNATLLVGTEGRNAPVFRVAVPPSAATPRTRPADERASTSRPEPASTSAPEPASTSAPEPAIRSDEESGAPTRRVLAAAAALIVFGGIAYLRARRRRFGGLG